MLRVTLFACAISAITILSILFQARQRIGENIQRTGSTIRQLINDEAARNSDSFRRTIDRIDLSTLDGMSQMVHFCAEVVDLYRRPVAARCFAGPGDPPHLLRGAMQMLISPDIMYRGHIGVHPGITAGELTVTPNLASEAADVWVHVRAVLWIAGGILLLNFLGYVPVHRALRPTEQILQALGRMEQGDLSVRLPRFELIELERISAMFNDLAARLQATMQAQRQLAERLLSVREEERRHLARELHDEFG
jgi:protein-histidine pros-kinase